MKKKTTAILLAAVLSCGMPTLSAADTVYTVQYKASAGTVAPGGTFDVTVSFNGIPNAVGYAVMLDNDSLTASDVTCTKVSEIAGTKAPFFAPDPNDANDVAAAYLAPTTLNGDFIRYTFTIPANAVPGSTITLVFDDSVLDSNNMELTDSDYAEIEITVKEQQGGWVLGDINGDGSVDIKDAMTLFQHSLLPDLFPITYEGSVDFTKDGAVDIKDAIAVFQYSMLPDLFPLA